MFSPSAYGVACLGMPVQQSRFHTGPVFAWNGLGHSCHSESLLDWVFKQILFSQLWRKVPNDDNKEDRIEGFALALPLQNDGLNSHSYTDGSFHFLPVCKGYYIT